MNKDTVKLHCLNSSCDDYEDLEAISSQVRRAVSMRVENHCIEECMINLFEDGLIHVFYYEAESSTFLLIRNGFQIDFNRAWFLITEKGREFLDVNWSEQGHR
jgi:hypothetical protein